MLDELVIFLVEDEFLDLGLFGDGFPCVRLSLFLGLFGGLDRFSITF